MAKPERQASKKTTSSVGKHPQIEELDNLQDFRSYVSASGIPDKPLVQKIEELQREQRQKQQQRETPKRYRKVSQPKATAAAVTNSDDDYSELTPLGRFMFDLLDYSTYLIPIVSVHVVLDVLVRVQYSEETFETIATQRDIFYRAVLAVPVFALLHFFVHPLRNTRIFRIVSFFASVAAGGYLLYASNEEGYYYVMKRAPPLGTLWVWMFVEMEWQWSATSLIVIAFWMWLKDYSI
ncbi:hypothetical protein D0Z03_001487 [Geotrichum reessii]|nr:hypothetical protein D0Z03_001487 [Galactomyces reessii]